MKVLIVSHNPISTYQNMGKTMLSLFDEFSNDELCQLYVYPSIPDVDRCSSYFRITDIDALRGIFSFHVKSHVVVPLQFEKKDKQNLRYYSKKNNRSHFKELCRDAIWWLSPWNNRELKMWLKQEKPTHIFVAPGSGKFLFNIALKISKDLHIPIVSYFCDDYYGLKPETSILGIVWQRSLKRKIRKLVLKSDKVVTICPQMSKKYHCYFGREALTIMTGANRIIASKAHVTSTVRSLTYMGNISINRYCSLAELAASLDALWKRDCKYYLDIYTGEVPEEIQKIFASYQSIRLHNFVKGEEYERIFSNSQALVHVEAFDDTSIDRVKYSVSTKIADILASGIPLFAYGPNKVASIKHLLDNDCAIIATKKNELADSILQLLNDTVLRRQKAENGLETAKKYHCAKYNSEQLKNLFC